jgi:hypothetical protein
MGAERKKVLIIAGCLVALIIMAVTVVILLFDINSYKPRIETAASEATGLDVRIVGKMGLSFFPFGVSANDVHVANKGGEILSIKELKLGVELGPLLTKQFKVTRCELVKPAISIVKDAEGKYNFRNSEKKSAGEGLGAASSLNELRLSQGALVYLDKNTGEKTELKEINLTIKDLSIGDTTEAIIKNGSFTGSFDCKEVLQKDFRIENLKAQVRAVKGVYNFEPLAIGALLFFDKKSGEKTELEKINLTIKDLLIADTSGTIIKHLSFTGNLDCKAVRKKELRIDNVKSPINVVRGVIYLMPLTMDIFGGKGEGDAMVDKSETDAVYKINLKISKLDFEELEGSFGAKKVVSGKGDFYASLTLKEEGSRALMSSVDGTFSLRGDNLVIYTMDLDKVLSSYETSQEFNLVDLGAFLIAGPFGSLSVVALHAYGPLSAVALKAYRYGDLYNKTRGGQGDITHFISHWKIKHGVADATDCAFATRHNRVALKGKLNLVSERFDNVTVALLDDKGCAKFEQSVVGSFGSPQISAVSAVQSLGSPFSNLYRKTKRFFRGGKCEVFYNGAVRQP